MARRKICHPARRDRVLRIILRAPLPSSEKLLVRQKLPPQEVHRKCKMFLFMLCPVRDQVFQILKRLPNLVHMMIRMSARYQDDPLSSHLGLRLTETRVAHLDRSVSPLHGAPQMPIEAAPSPAYSQTYGQVDFSQDGFDTNARVASKFDAIST